MDNPITTENGVTSISAFFQGEIVTILIDAEDLPKIDGYTWRVFKSGHTLYASRQHVGTILMHRAILGNSGLLIDHINGNGLDNRKANLRWASKAENGQNRRKSKCNHTSKYKGVSWHKRNKSWQVAIQANRKWHYVGGFSDEIEAAQAYDEAALRLHGKFACINFPEWMPANENSPPRVGGL